MPRPFTRAYLVAAGAILLTVSLAGTGSDDQPAPHVRGATLDTALLLDELIARSPTARDLVERLNQSDLLLYIEYRRFSSETLRGRIGLLSSTVTRRVFAIEIDPRHTMTDRLVALGHELWHAVEIADAASVRDPQSLAAFYAAIGVLTGDAGGLATYETSAAIDAARLVRSELAAGAAAAHAADRN